MDCWPVLDLLDAGHSMASAVLAAALAHAENEPVTTYQTHARIAKKIINHDAYGVHNVCMWDDCEREATTIYQYHECRHPVGWSCRYANQMALAHGDAGAHIWMAFCSERHLLYFRWSGGWRALAMIEDQGRAYGNLPRGSKGLGR